jgi:pimeloyl-ACP methyl ester carboxylesterase
MAALIEDRVACAVGKIQIWRGGRGQPLLYLHSATGEGPGAALLEELADRFDVIAPMFPGFGESEGIDQIDDIEDAVFHLLDLLDVLALAPGRPGDGGPAVAGMSLGGWMAAELAARYPERVRSLALVNPAGLHIDGAPIKEIFGRNPGELADDLFADQSHPMAQVMHQIASVGEDRLAEMPFELLRPTLQSLQATAKVGWNPYLHDPKLPRLLPRVTARTVIIHGEQDRLIPAVHAQMYASLIRGARVVEVPGGGHLVGLEQPSAVAAIITAHIGG